MGCPLARNGGWTLSVHHANEPLGGVILLGDGGKRRSQSCELVVDTIAGTGNEGFNGDGIQSVDADLFLPRRVALGSDGSVYLTDEDNNRIRRIFRNGTIETVVGDGQFGMQLPVDGMSATSVHLDDPQGIAVSSEGTIYFTDPLLNRVFRVTPGGLIYVFAGGGLTNGQLGGNGDGQNATNFTVGMSTPVDLAIGPDGSVYIADFNEFRVRRVGTDGIITTAAGNGFSTATGDRGAGNPGVDRAALRHRDRTRRQPLHRRPVQPLDP